MHCSSKKLNEYKTRISTFPENPVKLLRLAVEKSPDALKVRTEKDVVTKFLVRNRRKPLHTKYGAMREMQEKKKGQKTFISGARLRSDPGKPLRNDAGLRVKIRRLSWLVAETTAVAVHLNTPRPFSPPWPPTTTPYYFYTLS